MDFPSTTDRTNIFNIQDNLTPDDISGAIQTLNLVSNTLSISSGNSVNLATASQTTSNTQNISNLQTDVNTIYNDISQINHAIEDLSGSNTQVLDLSGDVISLSFGGGSVDINNADVITDVVGTVNTIQTAVANNTNKLAGISVVAVDISDLEYTMSDSLTVERVDGSNTFIKMRAEGQDHFQIQTVRENPGISPAQVKMVMSAINNTGSNPGVFTDFLTRYSSDLVEFNTRQGLAVRDPVLGTASQMGPDASGNMIVSGGMRLNGTIDPVQTLALNSGTNSLSISDGNSVTLPTGGGHTSLDTLHNLQPQRDTGRPFYIPYNQWQQLPNVGLTKPITVTDGLYRLTFGFFFNNSGSWANGFANGVKFINVKYTFPLTDGTYAEYALSVNRGFFNSSQPSAPNATNQLGSIFWTVENFKYPPNVDTTATSQHRISLSKNLSSPTFAFNNVWFQVERTATDTGGQITSLVPKQNGLIRQDIGNGNQAKYMGTWTSVVPTTSTVNGGLTVAPNELKPEDKLTDAELNAGLPSFMTASYQVDDGIVYPVNHDFLDNGIFDGSASEFVAADVSLSHHTLDGWVDENPELVNFLVEEHNVRHAVKMAGDASGNGGLVEANLVCDPSLTYDIKFDYRKDAADLSENQVAGMVITMVEEKENSELYDDQSYNLTHLTLFDASMVFDNSWHEISLPFDPRDIEFYRMRIAHDGDVSNSLAPVYVTNVRLEPRDPASNPTLTLYRDAGYQTVIGDASLSLGEYPDITGWTNYGNGLTSFVMEGGDVSGQFVGYSEVNFGGDEIIVTKDTQDWDGDLSWNDTVKSFKFRLAPYVQKPKGPVYSNTPKFGWYEITFDTTDPDNVTVASQTYTTDDILDAQAAGTLGGSSSALLPDTLYVFGDPATGTICYMFGYFPAHFGTAGQIDEYDMTAWFNDNDCSVKACNPLPQDNYLYLYTTRSSATQGIRGIYSNNYPFVRFNSGESGNQIRNDMNNIEITADGKLRVDCPTFTIRRRVVLTWNPVITGPEFGHQLWRDNPIIAGNQIDFVGDISAIFDLSETPREHYVFAGVQSGAATQPDGTERILHAMIVEGTSNVTTPNAAWFTPTYAQGTGELVSFDGSTRMRALDVISTATAYRSPLLPMIGHETLGSAITINGNTGNVAVLKSGATGMYLGMSNNWNVLSGSTPAQELAHREAN